MSLKLGIPQIVCERCHRDVEVLNQQFEMSRRSAYAHVRCHGEERLVEIRQLNVEPEQAMTWSQLEDVNFLGREGPALTEALTEWRDELQYCARQYWELAGMVASVVRSRQP